MTLKATIENILVVSSKPLTPQEIRSIIKEKYPGYYGTPSHQMNVKKGHYQNLDHALLAQIYSVLRHNNIFYCDSNFKPMKISLNQLGEKREPEPNLNSIAVVLRNSDDLISNLNYYYKRSLEVLKDFGGPSIYFHIQSIKEQEANFLSDRHIEMIYATLASWGMHKMGDSDFTKAKLVEFSDFKNSILVYKIQLKLMTSLCMDSCTQDQYDGYIDQLREIYSNLNVSISEATIVANSKTLAHILPNLIPPIDRQYTVRFFTQENKNFYRKSGSFRNVRLPKGIENQFHDFKKYCCNIKTLFDRCDKKMFLIHKESFNTSYPKIMDNLIMAFVKGTTKPLKYNIPHYQGRI